MSTWDQSLELAVAHNILTLAEKNGSVSWGEIMDYTREIPCHNPDVNNFDWTSIRGALQLCLDAGELKRVDSVHVEEYKYTGE